MMTKKKTGPKKAASTKKKSVTSKKQTAAKKKTTSAGKKEDLIKQLARAEKQLVLSRAKVAELRRKASAKTISDYTLKDPDGKTVKLSSLFGKKDDLIIIHNMGKSCSFCTLWADGFTGFTKHLENRAGFALVSHDRPAVLKEFASSRNWNYTYLSNDGGDFTNDMGFQSEKGDPWPGMSTFRKDKNGKIKRVSSAFFGPGDDFCSIWHMFDMLGNGPDGWEPKYSY